MDQGTQVNFPTRQNSYRRQKSLRKKHGLNDLHYENARSLPNPWLQIHKELQRPMRPKSLNLSTETFHRSKISFLSETSPKNSSPPSDISISQPISRERTPPGSLILVPTRYNSYPTNRTMNSTSSLPSCEGKVSCRCFFDEGHNGKRGPPNNTPDGLSWRRLHMSRAKLKATATTSELLSGFAMVAMVELQINEPTNVPQWLFIMFAVCTTVLVSVHIFALMISTYILPNIDAISKLDICELVSESPHERMKNFIEVAWAFSTVLGLFLFLVEVAILCWVKFWDYSFNAAVAATVVIIPVLIIFVMFAVHFYHSLVVYRCETSASDLEKLETMKKSLDDASSPV